MRVMIAASLLLNIVVLLPVCYGLALDLPWAQDAYGDRTPARGVVFALYAVIGLASVVLLVFHEPRLVVGLLMLQVSYKLLTPITVGSIGNPVVVANVLIATFHLVTLAVIWHAGRGSGA